MEFETSKPSHAELWQIQALPSDSWDSVVPWLSCCLPYFHGRVCEAWSGGVCHPSWLPCVSWGYVPSRVGVAGGSVEMHLEPSGHGVCLVHLWLSRSPARSALVRCVCFTRLSSSSRVVLRVRHVVGLAEMLLETFSCQTHRNPTIQGEV